MVRGGGLVGVGAGEGGDGGGVGGEEVGDGGDGAEFFYHPVEEAGAGFEGLGRADFCDGSDGAEVFIEDELFDDVFWMVGVIGGGGVSAGGGAAAVAGVAAALGRGWGGRFRLAISSPNKSWLERFGSSWLVAIRARTWARAN